MVQKTAMGYLGSDSATFLASARVLQPRFPIDVGTLPLTANGLRRRAARSPTMRFGALPILCAELPNFRAIVSAKQSRNF